MHVELEEGIERLLAQWQELFAADPDATPFESPGFAQAWWRHWQAGVRPWLLAVRDGEELVGLAPLVIRRRGPFRTLSELGRQPSNYWNVLALPHLRGEVVRLVAAEVARRADEWDAAVFGSLRQSSAAARALTATGLNVHRRPPVAYPGLELPDTFEQYLCTLPGSRRSNLRRHLRRLDFGDVELRELHETRELRDSMDAWQRLRCDWWAARGKRLRREHGSQRFLEFMKDMVVQLVPAGLAVVWQLRHDGRVVGVAVNLVDSSAFYYWLGGYDPGSARLGLGKIVIAEGIRSSIASGRRRFDFMVGQEPYKYWFGSRDSYCEWFMLTSSGARSRAARTANAFVERARLLRGAGLGA